MTKNEKRKCKDCFYSKVGDMSVLTCHKNPPIGETVKDENRVSRYIFKGYWPRVKKDDWCGSFLLKPDNG